MYYLKLHHLVDDKIHARSVGPYSLVTQQPLGGKAQSVDRDLERWRFGHWRHMVLHIHSRKFLQLSPTILLVVSTYESIVKGQNVPKPGIPESFKVLIKELQSLALDVKVLDSDDNEIDLRQNFDEDDNIIPAPIQIDESEIDEYISYDTTDVEDDGFIVDDNDDELEDLDGEADVDTVFSFDDEI